MEGTVTKQSIVVGSWANIKQQMANGLYALNYITHLSPVNNITYFWKEALKLEKLLSLLKISMKS